MHAEIQTADQLLRAQDVGRCELIRGKFRALDPASYEHGRAAMTLGSLLAQFVRVESLGTVFAAETGFWIARDPDTVRAPDAAFVRSSRSPGPSHGYYEGAPDLAVEVRSPDDRTGYVREKTAEWLESGVVVVWNVDPIARTVTVHERDSRPVRLREPDVLLCPSLLPGFEVPVAEIFA
jgi:Uma2 family endonuclease